jgi:K+ transporter
VIVGKSNGGLPGWERRLFDVMQRLSRSVAAELQIKANRRVELGIEVAV